MEEANNNNNNNNTSNTNNNTTLPSTTTNTTTTNNTTTTTTNNNNNNRTTTEDSNELQSILNILKNIFPYFILLLLRFLLTYIIRIFFLLGLFICQLRFITELNEQISLKSHGNKKKYFILFILSIIFFITIINLIPQIFNENLFERFLLLPYKKTHLDFISVIWITFLTDLSAKMAITIFKNAICLIMIPTNGDSRNHFNLSCNIQSTRLLPFIIYRNFVSLIPSFTQSNPVAQRIFQNSNHDDLESGRNSGDEDASNHSQERSEVIRSFLLSYNNTTRRRSGSSPTSSPNSNNNNNNNNNNSIHGDTNINNNNLASLSLSTSSTVPYFSSSLSPLLTTTSSSSSSTTTTTLTQSTNNNEIYTYLRLKRLFTTIDLIFTFYRSALPMPVWVCYFSSGPGVDIIPMTYICIKFINMSYTMRAVAETITNYLSGKTEYGRYTTEAELNRLENQTCTICFDNLVHPITLPCRHIFCEHCIYEWLDKENTCPVCRAEVREESSISAYIRESNSSLPIIM